MKFSKIYMLAAGAAVMATLASCSDVTDPVYTKPDASTFSMNVPPLQDQYFELTENGTFDLVLNGQPSYGFSAVTQYRAEVSLTPDFAETQELTPTGTGTLTRMTFKTSDLAMAMCGLHGITNEENYVDYGVETVYFRGKAFISGVESSEILTNNYVSLNKVQGYFAVPQPAYIFCIGNYLSDWISPDAANAEALKPYRISEKEDEIGSNVFYGTVDFGDNAPIFRFYTELSGWDNTDDKKVSFGPVGGNDNDTPVPFPDFVAGSTQTTDMYATKDSFSLPNFLGTLNIVVDMTNSAAPVATLTAAE